MAKIFDKNKVQIIRIKKKTSIGGGKKKTSSMNKHKRRQSGMNLNRG